MRCLLTIVLAMWSLMAWTAPVDSVAAREVAARFVLSGRGVSLHSGATTLRLAHAEPSSTLAAADYYIFEMTGGNGFVIVAGDDRAHQVLAYGDSPIDVDNVPDNVQWMLDQYKEQMEFLFTHPQAQPVLSANRATTVVPQLLTTKWGQRTPYRNQCPQVDGRPCLTGCVATAMAQVMNYWKYPSVLPIVPAYTTHTLRLQVPALPAAEVAWDLMLDKYVEGAYSEEEGDAVALLMRYCGQACKMDYGIGSSGAFDIDQLRGLHRFGFNPKASFVQRYYFTEEEWLAMLQDDLFAGRPVACSGSSSNSSHAFVIDGYDGSKYHVNWGWDGVYDGYFELNAVNGVGRMHYPAHAMLHGVCPADVAVDNDFTLDEMYYKHLGGHLVELTYKDKKFNSYSGNVTVPDSVDYNGATCVVRAVGDSAFKKCSKLTSVTLPGTIKRIGSESFRNSSITGIVIPDSVVFIGESAFSRCRNLEYVLLNDGLKEIRNYAFLECDKLGGVKLPASLTLIGNKAFQKTPITSIVIPQLVSVIGSKAFEGCASLASVTLGESVNSIGANAFNGCTLLAEVISHALIPPILADENCFGADTYATATLYVPASALNAYRADPHWSLFASIVAFEGNVPGDVNGDGEVNIADVNVIICAIQSCSVMDETLDVNGDGEVNIADVNAVISLILQGN